MSDETEQCRTCGFESTDWDDLDTRRTIGLTGTLFELWTDGMTDEAAKARPASEVWSAMEYADHTRETLFGLRVMIEVALERDGADLGPAIDPDEPGVARVLDRAAVLAALDEEAATFAARLGDIETEQWRRSVTLGGVPRTVRWAARHAVHDLWHHLIDIADGRVTRGDSTPADSGTVTQVNRSTGGVPKLPVDVAMVGRRGLEGDVQTARMHHGRPWQALCLWSADVIDGLRAEGHPIEAGSAGENLTLRGLDWDRLRAGTVLGIGGVRCQLSAPAVPCAKNARWFSDGDFNRILHSRHAGWSRWYASVLAPGEIRPGDDVEVIH